jgi:dTDP-4-dehydrorhamnose 3,5-epimerase
MGTIEGVIVTTLAMVPVPNGDVFHGMKATDPGYAGFGEAYFSTILPGAVKPWKRHSRMTLNLIVISGHVRFVVHDDRAGSSTIGSTVAYDLAFPSRYARLTVPPNLWMAFQGCASFPSVLLNLANISHDPGEALRKQLDEIAFDWNQK